MRLRASIVGVIIASIFAAPVYAQPLCSTPPVGLSEDDASRFDNMDTSRMRGLGAALRFEHGADRAVVADLFSSGLAPVDADLLVGTYQCRTIKMGGMLALTVYQWFRCEIGREDNTYTIRKITGSQNFFGTLTPSGSGYAYRGASHYGYEKQIRLYGADAQYDQVGCLSAVTKGHQHFVLELPFPKVESHHDVIELKSVH